MAKTTRNSSRVLLTIKTIEGKRRSSAKSAADYAAERAALISPNSRVGTTRSGSTASA